MSRLYDVVVLGATGFTGRKIVAHIAATFPADLRWAVAARSVAKLEPILEDIRLSAERAVKCIPAMEVLDLDSPESLDGLIKSTMLIINAIGPYCLFGSRIVRACATAGTHYVDITGETPWTAEMVRGYDSVAREHGAFIIPQCGWESTPADLSTFMVSKLLREKTQQQTVLAVYSVRVFNWLPSSGTVLSLLTVFDNYGWTGVLKGCLPAAMTPAQDLLQPVSSARKFAISFLRFRVLPLLGFTIANVIGAADVPVVYRTWSLLQSRQLGEAYGPDFCFLPTYSARFALLGFVRFLALFFGIALLGIQPVRALIRALLAGSSGTGPSVQRGAKGELESYAFASSNVHDGPMACCKVRWEGDLYQWTSIMVCETARVVLYNRKSSPAAQLGGGVLTPATLGSAYFECLQQQGTILELSLIAP